MISVGTPIRIGTKAAKNRITMAPTVKFMADGNGMVTEDFVRHYEARAAHGCGLICVEATCVAKEARLHHTQLGLWCDEQIPGHRAIAEACHKYGALVVPQIHWGGLGTDPDCGPLTSPTASQWNDGRKLAEAVELTADDIVRVEEAFIAAAVRAQQAGYDGVQLHGCHRYLINDFASRINQRTDTYGGSTENRARLGCNIIRGIRARCGEDFMISVRVSGCDPTVEEAIATAECYVAAGCDYLQVSSGVATLAEIPHDDTLPYSKVASLGVRMHEHFRGRVPVSCVNGFRTPEQVRYMIEHELTDTVDLACGLLADPAFTEAILYGAPYQPCRSCKGCCFGPDHAHRCPAMAARGEDEFGIHAMIAARKT